MSNVCCYIRISMNNLKDIHNCLARFFVLCQVVILGFQWTIWRIYTTSLLRYAGRKRVVILGFQWTIWRIYTTVYWIVIFTGSCYIRISMNNLKDIHNIFFICAISSAVVILGFQWTIWRIYTTPRVRMRAGMRCYIRISMNNLKDIHN